MNSDVSIENNNQVNVNNLNKDAKLNENESENQNKKNSKEKKINLLETTNFTFCTDHPLSIDETDNCSTLKNNFNEKNLLNTTSSESQNPSPNSTTNYKQSVLNNFNSWLSDISSGFLFQNFFLTNPFRKRGTRTPAQNSPVISRSNSKIINEIEISKEENDKKINSTLDCDDVKLLIGTIKPTLKGKELIELANFGVVEIDRQEPGSGHKFEFFPLTTNTFCDNCSEFIWTPIIHHSNSISANIISPYSKTVRCINCKYTCHYRCSKFVRINCQKNPNNSNDSNDKVNKSIDQDGRLSPLVFETNLLEQKILKYNQRIAHKGSGLGMYLLNDNKTFRGFLRVQLNLNRPINVIAGTRPPSIYDIINDEETASRRTLTTFYMPRDTVKNIHITSKNTSIDVIKAMLKKFKMVDNHQKFALYKQYVDENNKVTLSRLHDLDFPLKIALDWLDCEEKKFVLQENDTADINWENFQLPELDNFLKILDREEKEHMDQLIQKYDTLRNELEKLINYKNIFSDAVYV